MWRAPLCCADVKVRAATAATALLLLLPTTAPKLLKACTTNVMYATLLKAHIKVFEIGIIKVPCSTPILLKKV